jgi:hypothetical protein
MEDDTETSMVPAVRTATESATVTVDDPAVHDGSIENVFDEFDATAAIDATETPLQSAEA